MKQSISGVGQCCMTSLAMMRSPLQLTYLSPFMMRYSRLGADYRLICCTTSKPMYDFSQSRMCCIIYQSPKPIQTILWISGRDMRCCRQSRYLSPAQASDPGPESGPFLFQILFAQMLLKGVWQSYWQAIGTMRKRRGSKGNIIYMVYIKIRKNGEESDLEGQYQMKWFYTCAIMSFVNDVRIYCYNFSRFSSRFEEEVYFLWSIGVITHWEYFNLFKISA